MSETKEVQYAPHQQRVVEEANELKDKFSKLGAFILDNPIFLTLDQEEKNDLEKQYRAMEDYLVILERRISRF